jgi:two-component system invasion response regulator UvrY
VLALAAHDDPVHARRALQEGALGFLSKRSALETLLEAVALVGRGPALHRREPREARARGDRGRSEERLSERELDVFIRLAQGATVQKIAENLKISASTVGTHRYNIKQKLDVVNQSELTLVANRHGLIQA